MNALPDDITMLQAQLESLEARSRAHDLLLLAAIAAHLQALIAVPGFLASAFEMRQSPYSMPKHIQEDSMPKHMLIGMRARGLRRTEGGNQKLDRRPTLADLGLRDARSERWQARARARRRA